MNDPWDTATGLSYIQMPSNTSVQSILNIDADSFSAMEIGELERAMGVLAQYNIYVRKQIGILNSDVEYLEDKMSYILNSYGNKFKHLNSAQERQAAAFKESDEAQTIKLQLVEQKRKLAKIRDIPYGVDAYIKVIQKIYDKRIK